jgi:hypothetical protein
MKNELSPTVRLIRWNGHEIRYNEGDVEFAHEMLAHNLGLKNANLVVTNQCGKQLWQCVIVELDSTKEDDEEYLFSLAETATSAQNCFMVEMPREQYESLVKARKKHKNNVFDLHMGLYDSEAV